MRREERKLVAILTPFLVLIFWLLGLWGVLFSGRNELLPLVIIAFFVLNLGVGLWVNRQVKPLQMDDYRKYLILQTSFVFFWCPALGLIFIFRTMNLIPAWIAVLVIFYVGIGYQSGRKLLDGRRKAKSKKH